MCERELVLNLVTKLGDDPRFELVPVHMHCNTTQIKFNSLLIHFT